MMVNLHLISAGWEMLINEGEQMKEYQNLIGKIIIAAAIIMAAVMIANAIEAGCASIGSQIASAIAIS